MRCSKGIHVVSFTAGSPSPMEIGAVPGGIASFFKAKGGWQRIIRLSTHSIWLVGACRHFASGGNRFRTAACQHKNRYCHCEEN